MQSKSIYLTGTGILAGLAITASSPGQTIGIRVDGNVHLDVDTIPNEQFWVTESPDLLNWTNHTFVDQSTSIDCGGPVPDRRFYKLDPLYGPITWTQLPDMPVARDQFTGGVIDGKLYVFGGNGNPDGENLSRLDIYDITSGAWTRGADYSRGFEELSSSVVSGKFYIFGGYGDGGAVRVNLCYDPVIDTWTETAPKPTRIQAAPVVAWGHEIIVVGGYLGGVDGGVTTAIEAYNTLTNTWRFISDLPSQSESHGVAIHDEILYVIGGNSADRLTAYDKVSRFDLNAETWLPQRDGILPYPIVASYASACPVINGKIIIGGGLTTASGGFSINNVGTDIVVSNRVTIYDTKENAVAENTTLSDYFHSHLFVLAKEKLLILGGTGWPFGMSELTSRMYVGSFEE